ncbi:hypothetical protein MN608_10250 [Microdochium nivale]|nr:hypothetical protein MN608_10250 [Microdochium nivale]
MLMTNLPKDEDEKELSSIQFRLRESLARQIVQSWQSESQADGKIGRVTKFVYAKVVWGGLAATTTSSPKPAAGLNLLSLNDVDLLAHLRMMERRSCDLVMVMAHVFETKPVKQHVANGQREHGRGPIHH